MRKKAKEGEGERGSARGRESVGVSKEW